MARILACLYWSRLPPAAAWRLTQFVVRGASLDGSRVAALAERRLVPFPAVPDPPWGHAEVLLRTWKEPGDGLRSVRS